MNKSLLKSKTFYFGVITAVLPLWPAAGEWFSANIEAAGVIWGVLAAGLRLITKDKVVLVA
jgi:hypothetical protein